MFHVISNICYNNKLIISYKLCRKNYNHNKTLLKVSRSNQLSANKTRTGELKQVD